MDKIYIGPNLEFSALLMGKPNVDFNLPEIITEYSIIDKGYYPG